jgi:gas vesicle protein
MSHDSDRAASNLVCFLFGAAIGAAVALLYAPKEGAETRRYLGEKAEAAKEKATQATQTARERLHVVSEKVQEVRKRRVAEEAEEDVESGTGDEAASPA